MRDKTIINKEAFRECVLKTLDFFASPVSVTLGPDGLPVLIEREDLPPLSTKDGVTVARHINLKDNKLDVVVQAMKQAALKTDEEAGDGTTTAVVLMRAIIEEGMKYIRTGSISPQELVAELKMYEEDISSCLVDEMAIPIRSKEDQFNVACISSNNDKKIAEKIVEALEIAGDYGYISIEDGFEKNTLVKFIEGYSMPSGWRRLGPQGALFITHTQKNTIEYLKPAILIYDGILTDANDLANFYLSLTKNGTDSNPPAVIIIARGFEGAAFEAARASKQVGVNIALLKCPQHGSPNSIRFILDDLAIFTGAVVINHDASAIAQQTIDKETGEIKAGVLGSCDKIVISEKDSVIYNGYGDKKEIEKHIKALNEQAGDAFSPWEGELLKTRIAKLMGGIVEIQVGGSTQLEMKEKKFRVEDALKATKAAIISGIVCGGGIALLSLAYKMFSGKDRTIGGRVLFKALQAPIRQIVANTDVQPDTIVYKVVRKLKGKKFPYYGYNAKDKTFVKNMLESGIIDPAKVTSLAFKNAISIACELLCGGGMIIEDKQKNSLDKLLPQDMRPDLYLNESNQEM